MSVKGSVVGDVLLMCHPSQAACWALRLVVDLSAFFFPPSISMQRNTKKKVTKHLELSLSFLDSWSCLSLVCI